MIVKPRGGEKARERLESIRESDSHDKDVLFKSKVRWDGLSDVSIFLFFLHVRC